ncbi:unnamed protein product [Darwinula stevensoni]|uniref:Uncharacterized protein n=1 Tax=Darwinula stevensoni TaxID=69355 RepID=A0A7R8XG47_9CRUS|nr:unnamed protein product [Darwinula stevensoni]CAG0891123.1 unnamed protein product [Darwinula stevensoni]
MQILERSKIWNNHATVDKEVQLSKEHQQPKPVVHQHQSGSHHSPMVLQQATPVHEHRQGSHCPPPRTVQHPSELQQSTCVHQHEPRSRRPSSSAVQIPLEPQHVMAVHERRSQHPPSGTALASQNVQHPSELQQVLRVARSRLQPGSDESPSGSNTVALRQSPVSAPSLNDGKCKMPMQGTYSLMSKFLRDHVGCGHVLDFGQVFFRDRIGQSLKGFLLETSAEDFPNVREATRKLERLQLPSDPRSQLPRIPLLYPQDVALLLLLHKTLKPSEQECLSDYLQFLKEKNTRELRRIFHALKMLKESGHLPSHDDPKVDEARAALGIR